MRRLFLVFLFLSLIQSVGAQDSKSGVNPYLPKPKAQAWIDLMTGKIYLASDNIKPSGPIIWGNFTDQKTLEPSRIVDFASSAMQPGDNFSSGWIELKTGAIHQDTEKIMPQDPYLRGRIDPKGYFHVYPDDLNQWAAARDKLPDSKESGIVPLPTRLPPRESFAERSIHGLIVITDCPHLTGDRISIAATPISDRAEPFQTTAVRKEGRWLYSLNVSQPGKYLVQPRLNAGDCPRGGVWRPPTMVVDVFVGAVSANFVFHGREIEAGLEVFRPVPGEVARDEDRISITAVIRSANSTLCNIWPGFVSTTVTDVSGLVPPITRDNVYGRREPSGDGAIMTSVWFTGLPPGRYLLRPRMIGGSDCRVEGYWRPESIAVEVTYTGISYDPRVILRPEFKFYPHEP